MSYLDLLIQMTENVLRKNITTHDQMILIGLIEKESALFKAQQDTFLYFYTDVLSDGAADIFDFSSVLNQNYTLAQSHAQACISIFLNFTSLESTAKLHSWLQSAIRVVDCIVLHYIQEVLNEEPVRHENTGLERSRYIQINRRGVKAQKAGRIMDNLYDERNKMEHSTKTHPNNPNIQILMPPKYDRVKKQIKKRFPEALESFNEAFKEHYMPG